ncbi:nestin [Trichomycterus rosablanca]|uniref:nestin n=1 Tax=Trichomycterus rosablanca TaxID=2290929 RepID=UPI002F351956
MEISSVRHSLAYAGEEKYQMLELNKRLESYLNHVKLLEQENQLLWGEIQTLRRTQESKGHVKTQEEALSLARKEVQNAWREKDHVELEISNLLTEIEELNALRMKEVAAQAEAKRKVDESRKTLEDERRMQIWLREQAAHLQKEVSLQVQIHQEDLAALKSSHAITKPVLMAPQHRQALNLQGLGEEYSQRAAQVWQEAAGKYQARVEKLEEGLNQGRTDVVQLNQEKKESKMQMQGLAQELEATKVKREILEKNMAQQRNQQKQELQHLQAHVEALETEKVEISEQISELMVDRRNLLQMKMSLGLEVATYRALLDNESLKDKRNNLSTSRNIRTVSISDGFTRPPGTYPAAQTLSSCLSSFSGPQNTTSRSIARKANLMIQTSSGTLPRGTLQKTPEKAQVTQEEEVVMCEEKAEVKSSAGSTKPFTMSDFLDHYRPSEAHEEPSRAAPVPADHEAVDESELNQNTCVKDEVLKEELLTESRAEAVQEPSPGANEEELISSQTGNLSRAPHSPEREVSSSLHTEEAKSSDDGDEEETEVSTEMSQITHAPVSAWDENDTVVPEDRDVVSEIELESENVTENSTGEFTLDVGLTELKHTEENTSKLDAPFFSEPAPSTDSFSYVEEHVESAELAEVEENIIQFVEKEPLMSTPEVGIEFVERMESSEVLEDMRDVEGPDFDIDVHKKENQPEFKEEQQSEPRTDKEEFIYSDKQEIVIEENVADIPQVSSAPEVDAKIITEEQKAEPVIDTNDTDNQLDQFHTKEDQDQSDEESLNISASWRTDPGDVDSYAQENTLADTRPLIHYRSDDEADGNVEISHQGTGDATDSEEDGEKREGFNHWSQKIAKRFDTMEDLSEEPEMGVTNDTVTDGSVQTVLEQDEMTENMDEIASQESVQPLSEGLLQSESSDANKQVSYEMDDALVCDLATDSTHTQEEPNRNYNNDLLVEKLEETSHVDDWSESLPTDTSETTELQNATDRFNSSEEDLIKDYTVNWDLESMEFKPEAENVNKPLFGSLPPVTDEPLVEQTLEEEVLEESSMVATHTLEKASIIEQTCPQEVKDEQMSLSMPSDADLQHSGLNSQSKSQANIIGSDAEESNSSEDESPNASQCSQLLTHTEIPEIPEIPTQQLDWNLLSLAGETLINDPTSFSGLLEEALKDELEKDKSVDRDDPQAEETVKAECPDNEQQPANTSSDGIDDSAANTHEWEDLNQPDETTVTSQHILSSVGEPGDVNLEADKDEMNIFEGDLHEGSKEKENDPHTYFSSSIKEDIWSTSQFEMAATYDQAESERFANGSETQSKGFGDDWEDLGSVPAANGKPEKEMDISTIQPVQDKEEEQVMGRAEKLQRKDMKDGQVDTVHVEESTDDGDSWSSGEE